MKTPGTLLSLILAILTLLLPLGVRAELQVLGEKGGEFSVSKDGAVIMQVTPLVFKPGWGWMGGQKGETQTQGQSATYTRTFEPQDGTSLAWEVQASAEDRNLKFAVKAQADKDAELQIGALTFQPQGPYAAGKVRFHPADGGEAQEVPGSLPIGGRGVVSKVEFVPETGEPLILMIDPPVQVSTDKAVRVDVTGDSLKAGQPATAKLTLSAGEPIEFFPSLDAMPDTADTSNWFAFTPTNTPDSGAIGMQDWLKIPEDFLRIDGDKILWPDGSEFIAWGTNTEYSDTAPDAEDASQRAAWFAKYGVNVVRMHKLTNPGWEGLGSRESAAIYDPEALARFDFYLSEMRKHGVLYGLSPIWDLMIFEGDRDKLVGYEEIVEKGGRKPTTRGLVWLFEDVQDLHIATMMNLLNHKNPHTGIAYAKDPAVVFVEIQNEEDAFFFTTMPALVKYPTYKKLAAEKFSDWLKEKYGTQETLAQAWGEGLNSMQGEGGAADENLDDRNILPLANPWMWDNLGKDSARAQRLQDTAWFLLENQNRYYERMTQAIRDAGYGGPIITSNWQGGDTTGHLFNLYSDAKFGVVDRHNYLGGAKGPTNHLADTGYGLENATTLDSPGSELLSTGMQQVADTPFSISEWQAVVPMEWAAAETAIIAAYGMGLQGWDFSYFFASNGNGFTPTLTWPQTKKFNNQTPVGIGLFPSLSRMVLRGDVEEGEIIAVRRTTLQQAAEQTYDFEHKTVQAHDFKSFSGTPSHEAMAIGRVLVEFVEETTPSTLPENLDQWREGDTLVSTTGQLRWTDPEGKYDGWITINTPGTQGVVGFTPNEEQALKDVKIQPGSEFATILLSAAGQDQGDLSQADRAILTVVARARNTGMRLTDTKILELGEAPVIVEPVQAQLSFQRSAVINVLNQDGIPTGKTLQAENGRFTIDTGRDKTIWYEVVFQ